MYTAFAYEVMARLLMMAFYGSVMIVVAAMARVLLKGAPRWICCVMWAFVAFRLLCPFDIPSGFSFYNLIAANNDGTLVQYIQSADSAISGTSLSGMNAGALMQEKVGNGQTGQDAISAGGAAYGEQASGGRAMHGALTASGILYECAPFMTAVWAAGAVFMLGYMIWCSRRIRRAVAASVLSDHGCEMDAGRIKKYSSRKIFICDDISGPFVMGVLRPEIYVPSGMSDEKMRFAVAHEREHIIHGDNLWKMLGCIVRAVYWFDPLVWIAYRLFSRDIEIACDERVTKGMDREERAGYSQALLEYGMSGRRTAVYALGFGGSAGYDVKERVNRVINYKRPARWIVFIVAAVCIAAAACFLTGPADRAAEDENGMIITHSFSESIPDDVVLYADGMAESAAAYYKERSGDDVVMQEADITDISLVPTGTASNDSSIELYSISLNIRFDGKLDAGNDVGLEIVKDNSGKKWIRTLIDSAAPKYILMQCSSGDTYKKLCILSDADINEYDTSDMIEKYGNVYTAAAAELGAAYENGDLKKSTDSGRSDDNKAHSYRVVDGAVVSTGMSWKQDPGMKAFRVWVSNEDEKPMIVKVHSAFGYSQKAEIPAHTAAVVDINNNAHGLVTYELDFDSSDGKTSGYVVVETFDNKIAEDM